MEESKEGQPAEEKVKEGQAVYVVLKKLESPDDTELKLYGGSVLKVENGYATVQFEGADRQHIVPVKDLSFTPREAIDFAYEDIEQAEEMLAEYKQDLVKLEADLMLTPETES